MASTSESGHAINVANLSKLISFCTGYGADYNPAKIDLKLPALATLNTACEATSAASKATEITFDNASNQRRSVFSGLKPLATRIVNALASSSDVAALLVADAKTINKKIQGTSSKDKPPKPDNIEKAADKSISNSQQSYESLEDHFRSLVQLVSQEPNYAPNEIELQVATLNTTLAGLETANAGVVNTYTDWSNARIARDQVLYTNLNSLFITQAEVKKYVKSLYGATSPQYKQVSGLKFTKYKK